MFTLTTKIDLQGFFSVKKIRKTDTWQTFLQAVLVCSTRLATILILNVVEAIVHCNWSGNIRQFLHEAFIYYKNDILVDL